MITVDAADLTYDGFCNPGGLNPEASPSSGIGGGPGGSGGLIIRRCPGGGPKGGPGIIGTIPGVADGLGSPEADNGCRISGGGGGGGNREIPGGKTSACKVGIKVDPGTRGCGGLGGGGGIILEKSFGPGGLIESATEFSD